MYFHETQLTFIIFNSLCSLPRKTIMPAQNTIIYCNILILFMVVSTDYVSINTQHCRNLTIKLGNIIWYFHFKALLVL